MKTVIFFLFFASITGIVHAQKRICGSDLDIEHIRLHEPERFNRIQMLEHQTQEFIQKQQGLSATSSSVIIIPVVVHVVYKTSSQNVSEAQIRSQIDVLNRDFRRTNTDASNTPSEFKPIAADMGFQFVLACTDPNGNPTNGITRTTTSVNEFNNTNNAVKYSSQGGKNAWDAQRYLNIWV